MFGVKFENRYHAAAAALLLFLFFVNVYRAVTQSITVDEALTYNHFIARTDSEMATVAPFNYNLATWLSKDSVAVFGPSEFAMRLPSVLAGGLYFCVLFRLCALLFSCPGVFLLAIAVNSLNPFLLDFLSAARGYGLAIAFLTAGVYCAVRWIGEQASWKLAVLAGACFGLSVASHVTAVFPVAALLVVVTVLFAAKNIKRIAPMILVCAAISALTIWPTMHQARTSSVDGVVDKFLDGWKSLINCYLFYKPTWLTAWRPVHRLAWITIPVLLAGLFAAAAQSLRRRHPRETVVLVFSLAVPLAWLLLWIEPQIYHHGFFAERRLAVMCPLLFLGAPVWINWLTSRSKPERIFSLAGCTMMGLLCAAFALQWNVSSYLGWEQDAGSKSAMQILRQKRPADATVTATLGAGPYLYEGLNFYREILMLDWLKPVTQASPECGYDFYYVRAESFEPLKRFGLTELYRDQVANTVLAEIAPEAVQRASALRQLGLNSPLACSADVMAKFERVENADPAAERAMLRDFMPSSVGRWRWTFEHPALLMSASKKPGVQLSMEFVLHAATFKETGPVKLSVFINGRRIGETLYTTPEDHTFSAPVPEDSLRDDGIALVETSLDKYYKAPDDAQKMGYLFVRAALSRTPSSAKADQVQRGQSQSPRGSSSRP